MSKVFLILASVFAEIEGQRFVQRARDRNAYLRGTDRWGYGLLRSASRSLIARRAQARRWRTTPQRKLAAGDSVSRHRRLDRRHHAVDHGRGCLALPAPNGEAPDLRRFGVSLATAC